MLAQDAPKPHVISEDATKPAALTKTHDTIVQESHALALVRPQVPAKIRVHHHGNHSLHLSFQCMCLKTAIGLVRHDL